MAIAFRSAASATGNNQTCNAPAGIQAGDVLIALLYVDQNNQAVTPPAGWTSLDNQNVSAGPYNHHVYYKVAGSSEPGTYTFSNATSYTSIVIIAFSGVDNTTPIDNSGAAHGAQANASSTTDTVPSVTTATANTVLVAGLINYNGGTFSTLAGWTASAGANTSDGLAIQYKSQAATGATGTFGFTISGASVNSGSLLALKPAGAGGGSTVSGSANVAANAAITDAPNVLITAASVQSNATLTETARLLASATAQSNAAITQAAQLITKAAVQANAGISVSARILQAPANVQTNAAIAEAAQVVEPSVAIQANAVLSATGSLVGGIVSGTATMQANAALTEASAHILAPATMQSNAVLAATGGVVGKVEGSANLAANAGMIVHAVVLASVAPVQANAAISAPAQVTQPSITVQANAALVQTAAAVLASPVAQNNAALALTEALILATAALQANAVLDATGHIPLPAGYKSPVGTTVRRSGLSGATVLRTELSGATAERTELVGSTAKE